MTFLVSNKVIQVLQARYIDIKLRLKKIIYIIKTLTFLSNAFLTKFFLLIILIF